MNDIIIPQNILDLYILFIIGLSLKITTHNIIGKKKIDALYLIAWIKSNFKMENPALVNPHPGHGIPIVIFIKQFGSFNRYVIVI